MINASYHKSGQRRPRPAFTLLELVVVMTVMAILSTAAIPSFRRSLERSKADQASANLRAIWSAQQLFWLENRTYATSLNELQAAGMIDPTILSTDGDYVFKIQSATADAFSVTAQRSGDVPWKGSLTVDQSGVLGGSISAPGLPLIVPSL